MQKKDTTKETTQDKLLHRSLPATFHDIVSVGSFFVGQREHFALSSLRGHWGSLTVLPLIDAWCRCHLRTIGDPMPHLSTLETSPSGLWAVLLIMVSPTFCTLIGDLCRWLLIVVPPLLVVPFS